MTDSISDIVADVKTDLAGVVTWWEGTTIGKEIDNAAKSAIAELEKLTESQLSTIAEATATGALQGLATGGTAGAIAAGVTAAELAFKAAEVQVTKGTLSTFATTIANQVSTTPAP